MSISANQQNNSNFKIMLLDNETGFTDAYSAILSAYGFNVKAVENPNEAIEILKREKFDILISNYLLYPFNADKAIELIRQFDRNLYIILVTSHKDIMPPIETMHTLDIQAYCEKSGNSSQLIMMIEAAVKSLTQLNEIKKMNKLLKRHYLEFAEVLKNTVEAKDEYTKGHSDRVAYYSVQLGKQLNLSQKDLEILRISGLFHDIGKIGISDAILTKPGKLTDEEYEEIKKHPVIGYNIISSSFMLKDILPNVKYHHERIDGKGYPEGLKGDQIPYMARILAVCDTYDALTSNRAYRPGMGIDKAISILKEVRGTQLEAHYVDVFVDLLNNNREKYVAILNSLTTKK